MTNIIDEIMGQAQVFASAWSLVGGRFDQGDELANAEAQKAELRALVERALRQPVYFGFDMASGPDMSFEGLLRADEAEDAAQAGEQPAKLSFSGFVQRIDGQPVQLNWTDDATRMLKSSARSPYAAIERPDWAQCAALAIASDLSDRRGIKHGMTAVDPDVRIDLVNAHADIIRTALAMDSQAHPPAQSSEEHGP